MLDLLCMCGADLAVNATRFRSISISFCKSNSQRIGRLLKLDTFFCRMALAAVAVVSRLAKLTSASIAIAAVASAAGCPEVTDSDVQRVVQIQGKQHPDIL